MEAIPRRPIWKRGWIIINNWQSLWVLHWKFVWLTWVRVSPFSSWSICMWEEVFPRDRSSSYPGREHESPVRDKRWNDRIWRGELRKGSRRVSREREYLSTSYWWRCVILRRISLCRWNAFGALCMYAYDPKSSSAPSPRIIFYFILLVYEKFVKIFALFEKKNSYSHQTEALWHPTSPQCACTADNGRFHSGWSEDRTSLGHTPLLQ